MQLDDLLSFLRHLGVSLLIVTDQLQSCQLFGLGVVLLPQSVKFPLVLADSPKQRGVSLLPRQKLGDHLLHVGVASGGPDLLEGLFQLVVLLHLVLHLFLQEGAPEPLHVEVFSQLDLVHVFVLAGSCLRDLRLPLDSVHPFL